jgi:uncharacterized protein (TIGR03084 family)
VSPPGATVAELAAEQEQLQDFVRALAPDQWLAPTPARLWDVRDTISHLADADEMAIDTITEGPHALNAIAARSASENDVTFQGVMRGRRLAGADVLAWWERVAARERELLAQLDPSARVAWGIGMRVTSLVSARLMETWAHGLDVYAALHVEPVDTDRLAHVASLSTRALPYAYRVAGREPPLEPLRVELTLPSGAAWTIGSEDAPSRITGSASQYCRVFVRRMPVTDATDVHATGVAAVAALEVARAYL